MLTVEQLPTARNPIFLHGAEAKAFQIKPGEHFVIGQTTFTLSADHPQVTLDAPQPDHEQSFSAAELRRISFHNAQERIELLSRLPEVIKNAATDNELFVRLANLLLAGVPRADAAALVAVDMNAAEESPANGGAASERTMSQRTAVAAGSAASESPAEEGSARILHWDTRRLTGNNFQPSQRLIQQALTKHETILHTWTVHKRKNLPNRKVSIGRIAHHCRAMHVAAGRCTWRADFMTEQTARKVPIDRTFATTLNLLSSQRPH